jgi:hypothetical protein
MPLQQRYSKEAFYRSNGGLMKNNLMKLAGFALVGVGASSVCFGAAIPEIDPASGASALAMLAGAMLMIRGRRRR